MPVVRVELTRFSKMVGTDRKTILDRLPYIGLDIEGIAGGSVRVEYSPNRPDLGTDFGIARSLRGLLGKETGLPTFSTSPSKVTVSVDRRLSRVRPFIACCTAAGLRLDDEDVRQIISLQEDLHNGLGRRRRVVAIGLHDMDAITPPLSYKGVDADFSFVPLGARKETAIQSILSDTAEGREYGGFFARTGPYPVIIDAKGTVLSFPPIINGNATRVTTKTKRIFVDVTGTDRKAGEDVLAVLATTLAEAGGRLGSVSVRYPTGARVTPDLTPTEIPLDIPLIRSVLGMDLTYGEIVRCLSKSRIGVRGKKAQGPRYRIDLLHPVDMAEEVALGYGVDSIVPLYPPSNRPGSFDAFEEFLDSTSTIMAGSGFIEMMTFELTDEASLYSKFQRASDGKLKVLDPKTLEHSVLRDSVLPSLMASLSGNVRSDYPQRVFEIGRVYNRTGDGVHESWHLGGLVAGSQATFTEAKMYLEAYCQVIGGKVLTAQQGQHWAFDEGRCAIASVGGTKLGPVGEVKVEAIDAFGIGVPISGFEIDLSELHELLK